MPLLEFSRGLTKELHSAFSKFLVRFSHFRNLEIEGENGAFERLGGLEFDIPIVDLAELLTYIEAKPDSASINL